MDISYIQLLTAAAGLGIGTGAALKTFNNLRSDNKTLHHEDEAATLKKRKGASRSTNCHSLLPNGIIRLKNGHYVRGFLLKPQTTLWSSGAEVDALYDELAGILRANLPIGTGMQFRTSIHPEDSGFLLDSKISLLSKEDTHPIAQQLKLDQLQFLSWLSENRHFHRSALTLWVYLPLRHENENNRNGLTELFASLKKDGFKGLQGKSENIVKRTLDEETELLKKAENYFTEIEQMCPLEIRRLDRNETWQALYFSYNENADVAPDAPSTALIDLSQTLCSNEDIKDQNNWFLLQGNTPVTMLTMFVPPESDGRKRGCYAGMMRGLSNNAGLRGRFTIITEYITEDKNKVEKELSRSKWKLRVASNRPSGKQVPNKKSKRAYEEIDAIEDELVSQAEALVKMRFRILVYGKQAFTASQLEESVKELDKLSKEIIKTIRKSWRGADVALEEPIALRQLYENTLLGNMETKGDTGRELKEQAYSYCAFIAAEESWDGMPVPHSLKKTITGKTFGLNFWRNPLTKSPLVCILGASGSGKSVEAGTFVVDVLAEEAGARVKIVDFGETYATLCEVLGGRHIRFMPDEERTLNIWDYQGLELGEAPEEPQVNLVVEDATILAGFDPESDIGRVRVGILHKCVVEVYKDFVPRNRQKSGRRHEPTLTNLIHKLRYFPFETKRELDEAAQMASSLSIYEGNTWLDAPTHEYFRHDSRLDVYELDSLHLFPLTVRKCLAFRTGSKVIRSIGEKISDDYTKTLLLFDEMHEYNNPEQAELRVIFRAMEKGARKGRKTNVVTMLASHGWEDLSHLHGLTKNAGVFIVGKQDDITSLKQVRKWSDEAASAVLSLNAEAGSYSQFVVNVGMGDSQKSELIQSDLSPTMLWTMTSDPNERNAREKVKRHFPHFTPYEVVAWLAGKYPRGLTYEGKTQIDAILLPPVPVMSQISIVNEQFRPMLRDQLIQNNQQEEITHEISVEAENSNEEEFEKISEEDVEQMLAHL